MATAEAFHAARERYLRRLLERYARVDLEILTPLTEQGEHPVMLLGRVFVPQTVRENPPPVDLPREVWRRLAEEGHLEATDLPSELDRTRLEEARRAYQQRPTRPVLQAVADPAARKTVVLGDPGAGKSTLARYLMLALAAENGLAATGWEIPPELAGRLPLLVELRTFADQRWRGKTFLDLLDELERCEGLGIPNAGACRRGPTSARAPGCGGRGGGGVAGRSADPGLAAGPCRRRPTWVRAAGCDVGGGEGVAGRFGDFGLPARACRRRPRSVRAASCGAGAGMGVAGRSGDLALVARSRGQGPRRVRAAGCRAGRHPQNAFIPTTVALAGERPHRSIEIC
jgi:hypothetical protein